MYFKIYRVKFREDMYSDKLKVQAEEKREKELEKLEREQRLEALAATVMGLLIYCCNFLNGKVYT